MTKLSLIIFISICTLQTFLAVPLEERDYQIVAYQVEGEEATIVLRITPEEESNAHLISNAREGRQEDEDEDAPATTPFIPEIIPGVTKIFNGILTGNLNEIFHGSTSFAPKEVGHSINTVYNQVVGLPAPRTTVRTTTGAALSAANSTETAATVEATTASTDDDDDEAESEFVNPDFVFKKKASRKFEIPTLRSQ